MSKTGKSYYITLNNAHLNWGIHRNTYSRGPRPGEGYIPIKAQFAREHSICNEKNGKAGFGSSRFTASSKDGFLKNVPLLAQGCSQKGDPYAKQFAVKGDLSGIGSWYQYRSAQPGDQVKVEFISEDDILLEHIPSSV